MSASKGHGPLTTCAVLALLLGGCVSTPEEPPGRPTVGVPVAGDELSGTVWIRYEGSTPQEVCWTAALIELPNYTGPTSCDVSLPIEDVAGDHTDPPQGPHPFAMADVTGTYRGDGQLDDVVASPPEELTPGEEPLVEDCEDTDSTWLKRIADDVEQSAVLAELERRSDLVTRFEFPLLTPESNVIVASSVLDPADVRAQLEPLWPNVCVLPARWDRSEMRRVSRPLQEAAARLHWSVQQDFDGGVTVSMLVLTAEQQSFLEDFPQAQVRPQPELLPTDG